MRKAPEIRFKAGCFCYLPILFSAGTNANIGVRENNQGECVYLGHIRDEINFVLGATNGLDREEFLLADIREAAKAGSLGMRFNLMQPVRVLIYGEIEPPIAVHPGLPEA